MVAKRSVAPLWSRLICFLLETKAAEPQAGSVRAGDQLCSGVLTLVISVLLLLQVYRLSSRVDGG